VRFTIFGGSGFIGSALCLSLAQNGHEVHTPPRERIAAVGDGSESLGHVVYAVGLTGDFRDRPMDVVDAHAGLLARLLAGARYESWLYLSSTRVYGGLSPDGAGREDSPVPVVPCRDSTYDLSKLLGESLCLAREDPRVRIARLSNVFGPGMPEQTFLGSVLARFRAGETVTIGESPESSKDYAEISGVCEVLESIALRGGSRLYNVASGDPVTHGELAAYLETVGPERVRFADDAPTRRFPRIDVSRIVEEFDQRPRGLMPALADILGARQGAPTGKVSDE